MIRCTLFGALCTLALLSPMEGLEAQRSSAQRWMAADSSPSITRRQAARSAGRIPSQQEKRAGSAKLHVLAGAVGGALVAAALYVKIEGDNESSLGAYAAVPAVLTGAVAGGAIGWVVYKLRR